MKKDKLAVRGARVHNLQNIDIDLPRNSLVVLTGLSGSGKSSLAFDTIYAEGQRRYVESLSAYARQFLGQMEKPDVDSIDGLSPAISIDQKTTSRNPRSTVGTVTEIYDYLRLLWARVGSPFCAECGAEIASQSAQQIADQVLQLEEGASFMVMSPLVQNRKGEYKELFDRLKNAGYSRIMVDGDIYLLEEAPSLDKQKKHDISLVVDRLKMKEGIERRLRESIATALQEGDGLLEIELPDEKPEKGRTLAGPSAGKRGKVLVFSQRSACKECGATAPELEPRLFSFNSPHGACQECHGLGYMQVLDPDLLVPDPTLSIDEGVLEPFFTNASRMSRKLYEAVAKDRGIDMNTSWQNLKQKDKDALLYGTKKKYSVSYTSRFGSLRNYDKVPFRGVLRSLERQHSRTESEWKKRKIEEMMSLQPCPSCQGARLSPAALAVKVDGTSIWELSEMSVDRAHDWAQNLSLTPTQEKIARLLLREIRERLSFLVSVGLGYLSLERSATTLSGGEAQRIRLATQIGSSLTGVLYVLDEPSIGLHQRDNEKLIATLQRLRDLGNTVIVVEHDEGTMLAANWLVDLGPGAGEHGGEVVAAGTPAQVKKNSKSLTGKYLSGKESIAVPKERREAEGHLRVLGAKEHNLKDIDVSFPLRVQTCVTGVSGSGKSTLVNDILYPAAANRLTKTRQRAGSHEGLEGLDNIDKIVQIDQSPIGRTPRSNPATYTGVFDQIRALYAETKESRARGYKPGRFSFNVRGGRCERCEGDGELKIEMHFLPDVYVPCEECHGKRYNEETLEVHYGGKSIADVLAMPVEEALVFFKKIPKISRRLQTLYDVGLGYIRLGQPATQLSGGEAQRVKLATELSRVATGDTLYILDEPTTGLHFEDVRRLLDVLSRLVGAGNSVVVIEHNLDVIAASDWIIDLGPEGGEKGGNLLAEGTPEAVAKNKKSETGRFLRQHFTARKKN